MPTTGPRIPPLTHDERNDEQREVLGPLTSDAGQVLNIHATIARHPKLLKRWLVFGSHVLMKSSLPDLDRELLILRVGWQLGTEYEFGEHVRIGRGVGLTDEEIRRVTEGPGATDWSPLESALLRAADELLAEATLSDATWKTLEENYSTEQLLDLIFTVGQYNLVCMALNTLRIEQEKGAEGFPQ